MRRLSGKAVQPVSVVGQCRNAIQSVCRQGTPVRWERLRSWWCACPCSRLIPVSESYDGENFFTTAADGVRMATPLLLALAVVEISDVVFAVDSIPAVSSSLPTSPRHWSPLVALPWCMMFIPATYPSCMAGMACQAM